MPFDITDFLKMWKAFESSSSSNLQHHNSHSRDGYHQKLYNEAFYNDMKDKYNVSLQSLLVKQKHAFEDLDTALNSPLLSLAEISKSVKSLLFQRADDDSSSNALTSVDDAYVKKWKQLLFITEKNIIKTQLAILNSSSGVKSIQLVPSEPGSSDTVDASLLLQEREEKQKTLYVQAIDNFELMLNLLESQECDTSFGADLKHGRSEEGFDLLMLQLVLSLSLKCHDYFTYKYLLITYSSKFNRFYDKYLENQWKILANIPKISSSFSSVNHGDGFPPSSSSLSNTLLIAAKNLRIPCLDTHITDSNSAVSVTDNGIRFYSFLFQYFSQLLPSSSTESLWNGFSCHHILESFGEKFGHIQNDECLNDMEIVKEDKAEDEMEDQGKDSSDTIPSTRRQTRNSTELTSSLSNPDLLAVNVSKTTDLKLRSSAVHDGDATLFTKLEVIPVSSHFFKFIFSLILFLRSSFFLFT
jgi:hypothetical protein